MAGPLDPAAWTLRGRALGAFPDDLAQAAYLAAWVADDYRLVAEMLEAALAGPYPLPGLNWLAFPALYAGLDVLGDGPAAQPEDWGHADFLVRTAAGAPLGAAWFTGGGPAPAQASLDHLLADLAGSLLPLRAADKPAAVRALGAAVLRAAGRRPASLADLVAGAVGARLLGLCGPGSPVLRAAVPAWAEAAAQEAPLLARAGAVAAAWWAVLGSPGPRPLTLLALRQAWDVSLVDQLLQALQCPASQNLVTYLRCADLPA